MHRIVPRTLAAAVFATAAVLAAAVLVAREPRTALASDGIHRAAKEGIHRTARLTPARAEDDLEGTWTITPNRRDGRLQLNLHYETSSNWGRGIDRADLQGLSDEALNAATSTPASFRIVREAGVFDMEGAFRQQEGAGHFRFQPNREFVAALRSLGVEGADAATDRELMSLAMADATEANIRGLMELGLGRIDMENLVELSIFEVTPAYVREIAGPGDRRDQQRGGDGGAARAQHQHGVRARAGVHRLPRPGPPAAAGHGDPRRYC
jgi:hypothetical protein